MASWQTEYLAALQNRDRRHNTHKRYIDAYTKLADRTSTVSAPPSAPPSTPQKPSAAANPNTPTKSTSDDVAQLRSDLSSAQRSKATLITSLERLTLERDTLLAKHTAEARRATSLTQERNELSRRMRDKNEELRGKAKLAQEAQDEMVALQLQLHVAEEKTEKLEGENRELVDRWMRRVGKEADEMNERSKFT